MGKEPVKRSHNIDQSQERTMNDFKIEYMIKS